MKKCLGLAAVICLFLFCLMLFNGADAPETASVFVGRRGQISAWLVEDFAEDYYSIKELAEMAVGEAAEYNAKIPGKKAVTVEKVGRLPGDSGKIRVCYRFDGWESYTGFNGQSLFYGTVEEAVRKGFDVGTVLKEVSDGRLSADESLEGGYARGMLWAGDWLSLPAGSYVIVTDVKANIYCPREVTHISEGASVNEDGSVDTSGTEGTVCILMK